MTFHEIQDSKNLKFENLENEKNFWSETKIIFSSFKMFICRLLKQNSKKYVPHNLKTNLSKLINTYSH